MLFILFLFSFLLMHNHISNNKNYLLDMSNDDECLIKIRLIVNNIKQYE